MSELANVVGHFRRFVEAIVDDDPVALRRHGKAVIAGLDSLIAEAETGTTQENRHERGHVAHEATAATDVPATRGHPPCSGT